MSRPKFSEQDINDSIFVPNKDKEIDSASIEVTEKEVYTIMGKHTSLSNGFPVIEDENSKLAYAKRANNRFFIKCHGSKPIDPLGIYTRDLDRKIGDESIWRWTEVGYKTFDLYVTYLKTKNKTHYTQCTREII